MNQAYYNEQRKIRDCEKLGLKRGQWAYIKGIGNTLRRLYEEECNGFRKTDYTEDTKAAERNLRWQEQYENKARKFAKSNGLYLYLQTDCRGATIYLDTKEIPENNYNQAVCIY
jgi:hypothetical protein